MTKVRLYFVGKYQHPLKSANCHKMLAFNSLWNLDLDISPQKCKFCELASLNEDSMQVRADTTSTWDRQPWFRRKNTCIFQRQHGQATWSSSLSFFIYKGSSSSSAGQGLHQTLVMFVTGSKQVISSPYSCLRKLLSQKSFLHLPEKGLKFMNG